MDFGELAKEWRIWVLALALLISTVMLVPWNNPTLIFDTSGDDIGLQTTLENRTSIQFSGGTRMLLKLESNATDSKLRKQAEAVRQTLEIRLSNLDIPDPSVRVIDIGGKKYRIQIQASVDNKERLKRVIQREGSFEARMPIPVQNSKEFTLSGNTFNFNLKDNHSVLVAGPGNFSKTLEPEDRFETSMNGIEGYNTSFVYTAFNSSTDTAELEVVAYDGNDIESVVDSDSRLSGRPPNVQFSFPVMITADAAKNVLHVSQNYETPVTATKQSYLRLENGGYARLGLYVDGNRESSLRMASVFAQKEVLEPSIQGGAKTRAKAEKEMAELQVILESGSLEKPVKIVSSSTLTAALGNRFMTAAILSIIGSLIAVGFIIFIRYRTPKLAIPIVLTGASEVYILLGAYFTTAGTLSLSAVAGIIAAVGTGVDDQIIITDESGKESLGGWQKKMKRAFFVIFTSAASTTGAMAPILAPSTVSFLIGASGLGLLGYTFYTRGTDRHYVGIGVFSLLIAVFTFSLGPSGAALSTIHEFAKTTILGILIGITITRPAYAKTVEYLKA